MKRIAIIAPYVGTVNRGVETFVIELTRKLSVKYEIDIYCLHEEPLVIDNCIIINAKENPLLKLHKDIYNTCGLYRKVINKFYYLIPDVVFQNIFTKCAFKEIDKHDYNLLFPNNGIWGAKYARNFRNRHDVPWIYTGHGGIGLGEKIILHQGPDYYISLTQKQFMWSNENKNIKATKTCVIPNGVNVKAFERNEKINNLRKTVISVAALTFFKRHHLTIRAMSLIENVDLVILGEGEEKKVLQRLAERLLPGRCIITSVPYKDVKKWYHKADLFVLPSLEEPFGIVYLEAMASNLPVVAPDDSQRREIIGEAGMFCDVENIDEYADHIRKALNLDWKNKPYFQAQKYDWDIVASKYADVIVEVCKEHEPN